MKKIILIAAIIVTLGIISVSCESNTYSEVSKVTNPTYSKNIQPIINSKCVSCHSVNSTIRPESPFDTYQEVKTSCELPIGDGGMLCLIDDQNACGYDNIMPPPSNGGRMPQTTIDMIKLWASQGYAE
jgi:uncharacterized membrane protein